MSKKILLSALFHGGHPFDEVFDIVYPIRRGSDVNAANEVAKETGSKLALVIWGGADISPTIYNQKVSYAFADSKLSQRDQLEVEMGRKAIDLGIPVIGVCRGAQLMCCLSGGSLVQHVDGHGGGWHPIITKDGEKYSCPSLHHQMMYPWGLESEGLPDIEHEYIAWMEEPRSQRYIGPPTDDETLGECFQLLKLKGPEPEILWFPRTKSLCIQSHPEFIDKTDHPFVQYVFRLTKQYILGEKTDVNAGQGNEDNARDAKT